MPTYFVQGDSLSPPCCPGTPIPASTFYRLGAQRKILPVVMCGITGKEETHGISSATSSIPECLSPLPQVLGCFVSRDDFWPEQRKCSGSDRVRAFKHLSFLSHQPKGPGICLLMELLLGPQAPESRQSLHPGERDSKMDSRRNGTVPTREEEGRGGDGPTGCSSASLDR